MIVYQTLSFYLDGLGQLTDGILAADDYRLTDNVQGIGEIGYDWIGWHRKLFPTSNLNLFFYFNTIRNFTTIRLHTSNLFLRNIYIFNSIMVTNCKDNINQKIFSIIPYDHINTRARFINVSLVSGHGMITNCLKVTLTFNNRSKWILISEVLFDSTPIMNNILLLTTTDTNNLPGLFGKRRKRKIFLLHSSLMNISLI